jgi:hypothetical protein
MRGFLLMPAGLIVRNLTSGVDTRCSKPSNVGKQVRRVNSSGEQGQPADTTIVQLSASLLARNVMAARLRKVAQNNKVKGTNFEITCLLRIHDGTFLFDSRDALEEGTN